MVKKEKVIWVIEKDMFDYEKLIKKSIEDNGDMCVIYDFPYSNNWVESKLSLIKAISDITGDKKSFFCSPIICHGSIRFINFINKLECYPGAYANFNKFDCTSYYNDLKEETLLNRDYFFLPFGSIKKSYLIDNIKKSNIDDIFIRPNSGDKSFTGRCIKLKNLEQELDSIKNIDTVSDNELCLISKTEEIEEEYRFIIIDNKVISCSKYKSKNELDLKLIDVSSPMFKIVQEFINKSKFYETAYTIDICSLKNSNEYKIIELNSFSSADLYRCDLNKIVEKISEISILDWKDVFE